MPNTDIYNLKEALASSINEAVEKGVPIVAIGLLLENLLIEVNRMTAETLKHEQQVIDNSED